MLRSAVVGCGIIHSKHTDGIVKAGGTVAAVCDCDFARAEKTAAEFSASAYSDFYEMLKDETLDAVHICTPHYLHADMAISALRAGKHVFCEKPMTISRSEAEEVIKAQDESGKQMGVCFQNRYLDSNTAAKKIIDSGELGRVMGAKAIVTWHRDEDYYRAEKWRGKWKTEGGGVLINQAIHTIDLLQWFLGGAEKISGKTAQFSLGGIIETEDSAMLTIENSAGVRAVMFATNAYITSTPVEIEIILENGILRLRDDLFVLTPDEELIKTVKVERYPGTKSYWGIGHENIIKEFYRCLRSGEKFPVDAREGAKTIKILEEIYK